MNTNDFDLKLIKAFNDNKVFDNSKTRMRNVILAEPKLALRNSVIGNNEEQFDMTFALLKPERAMLDDALFFAVGFDRRSFMARILNAGASWGEIPNGNLLHAVFQRDMAAVRVSLNNPDVNVNAHDQECFKQAILGDRIDIAEELRSKTNVAMASNDRRFYNKVLYTTGISRQTIDYYKSVAFAMPGKNFQHIPS